MRGGLEAMTPMALTRLCNLIEKKPCSLPFILQMPFWALDQN